MVIRVPPKLPGFQLLRDTFAGKNLREIWRRETDSEKVQNFYRQKCRATAEILGTWELAVRRVGGFHALSTVQDFLISKGQNKLRFSENGISL